MGKIKLNLQTGYIADAIIQTKKNRFNEEFTTMDEVNIIKEVLEKRIEQRKLNVKFIDAFFKRYFNIINGVITKVDEDLDNLSIYIGDTEICQTIYDEDFIYLCLCEIMINKLNNSIEHTCSTCDISCCDRLCLEQYFNNKKNKVLIK